MALKQGQQLAEKQSQQLKLSQSMQQSIMMLQLDTIDLLSYLKESSLENPLFDVQEKYGQYVASQNTATYQIKDEQRSLFEYLLEQIQLTMRQTSLRDLVIYLVEQLDPNGYLQLSDEEILTELAIEPIMLQDAKTLLQRLDPPGVGARSLQECLLLQAQHDEQFVPVGTATILTSQFEALVAHDWQAIQTQCGLTANQVAICRQYIQQLTAAPGQLYANQRSQVIVPDLILKIDDEQLTLSFSKYGDPELIFANETYQTLKQSTDQEVRRYINEKESDYQKLVYNLERRKKTISLIGRCIIAKQQAFFLQQTTSLAPLLLRDIANELQLSESTVSRAVNGKYLQTPTGTFELKTFFARRSKVKHGETMRSVDQVQKIIQQMIAKESPQQPLSDQKISEALKVQGLQLARRTVAKYREELAIPPATKRRKK